MRGSYKSEYVDLVAGPTSTYEDLDKFCELYKEHCRQGLPVGEGQPFPKQAYSVSKAAEIALTMVQARQLKPKRVLVNCVSARGASRSSWSRSGVPGRGGDPDDRLQGPVHAGARRGLDRLPGHRQLPAHRHVLLPAQAHRLALTRARRS